MYSIIPVVFLFFIAFMDPAFIFIAFVVGCITLIMYIYYIREENHPLWYVLLFPLGAVMLLAIGTFSI